MSLYTHWHDMVESARKDGTEARFWNKYLDTETNAYKKILADTAKSYSGSIRELAAEFDMPEPMFAGFIDGINTSLVEQIELDTLESDTVVKLDIDFEKLYFNMHEAKADWLYGLKEWDDVLSGDTRKRITREYRESKQFVHKNAKISPNSPCPCGSGKKYKRCCGKAAE